MRRSPNGGALKHKTSKDLEALRAGYQKGQETRERILNAALKAFGDASFLAVTTRQIAGAASVSLPTLQYHFGDKEGLYRACAEAIVERYRRQMKPAGAQAAEALGGNCSAEAARALLGALMRALAGFLVGSSEAGRWAQFVARELRDPGPAFEILYAGLWRPGVEITARLICRILGSPEGDPAARVRALLLISSLLVFQSGRNVSLRAMHWSAIGSEELALVLAGLDAQIEAIGRTPADSGGPAVRPMRTRT
ncbi:MAG TPA: CerR family C-terminal domain-containing protein [Steroidobacteraceae bacterium]|nr:CerR family C-terminal domain-containing protein [Steroidobacteraceae bacterium]